MSELNQITEQAQVMTPATTPTTSPRASMEPSADQSAETVVPETPAVKLSESEQKLQDYFDEFTQYNKSDPRVYFHAMEFDRKWLSRTNAYEVACTLLADAYVCFTNRHNVASRELMKAYVGLSTSKGVVSVMQLARKVIDLRNKYRGNSFLQSTVTGYRFRVECEKDESNSDVYLTKDETYVKLDVAKFKQLVKAFRLYVECACARMFPRNLEMKKWTFDTATYTDDRSGNKRSSLEFGEFARELLNVHWKLFNFSEKLVEVESVMVGMKAASQKAYEQKKLDSFSKTATLDKSKGHTAPFDKSKGYTVKKNPRSDVTHTKHSSGTRKFTVLKPVGPPPQDAWKNGNPVVKKVEPVVTSDQNDESVDKQTEQTEQTKQTEQTEHTEQTEQTENADNAEGSSTGQETSDTNQDVKPVLKQARKVRVKGKSENTDVKKNKNDGQWHTVRSRKNSVNQNGNRGRSNNNDNTGDSGPKTYSNTRKYDRPLR